MRAYTQQLTVEQFGGMVATASRIVGSHRGPYIGYTPTGSPLPVRFDPAQAPREDRASAVLLIGTLGSGKTVAAQTIEYAAERRGQLDGRLRPEARPRASHIARARRPRCRCSSYPAPRHSRAGWTRSRSGCPICREELAVSYLLELLPGNPAQWENAISLAVKETVREGSRSLLRVVDLLLASDRPGAKDAGEALQVIRDFGLARLGFGNGETGDSAGADAGHDDPYAGSIAAGPGCRP